MHRIFFLLSLLFSSSATLTAQSNGGWNLVEGPTASPGQHLWFQGKLLVRAGGSLAIYHPTTDLWERVDAPGSTSSIGELYPHGDTLTIYVNVGTGTAGDWSSTRDVKKYYYNIDQQSWTYLADLSVSNSSSGNPSGPFFTGTRSTPFSAGGDTLRYHYLREYIGGTLISANIRGYDLITDTPSCSLSVPLNQFINMWDDGSGANYISMPDATADTMQYLQLNANLCRLEFGEKLPSYFHKDFFRLNNRQFIFARQIHGSNLPDTLWTRTLNDSWQGYQLPPGSYFFNRGDDIFVEGNHVYFFRGSTLYRTSSVGPLEFEALFTPPPSNVREVIRKVARNNDTLVIFSNYAVYISYDLGATFTTTQRFPVDPGVAYLEQFGDDVFVEYSGLKYGLLNEPYQFLVDSTGMFHPFPLDSIDGNQLRGSIRYPMVRKRVGNQYRTYVYHNDTDTLVATNFNHFYQHDNDRLYRTEAGKVIYSDDGAYSWDTVQLTPAFMQVGTQLRGDTLYGYRIFSGGDSIQFVYSFDFGQTARTYERGHPDYYHFNEILTQPNGLISLLNFRTEVSDDYGRTFTDRHISSHHEQVAMSLINTFIPARVVWSDRNLILLHQTGELYSSLDFGITTHPTAFPFSKFYRASIENDYYTLRASFANDYENHHRYFYAATDRHGLRRKPLLNFHYGRLDSPRATLSGYLFKDTDENCAYADNEDGITGEIVVSERGDTTYTDDDGYYELRIYPGTTAVAVPTTNGYELNCGPAARSVTLPVAGTGEMDFAYFEDGLTPPPPPELQHNPTPTALTFPSPATTTLHFAYEYLGRTVRLFDVNGRTHFRGAAPEQLDVSGLLRGVYFLQHESTVQKVILH